MQLQVSHDDMANCGTSILSAFQTVLAQSGEENRLKIQRFAVRVIMEEKPYLWVTPQAMGHLMGEVFGDELIRDFVLSLQFHFFMRWGEASQKFTTLTHALSWSVAPAGQTTMRPQKSENDSLVAIPQVIQERLTSREDAQALMESNPWLVCLLLMRSYITLTDPKKVAALFKGAPGMAEDVVL